MKAIVLFQRGYRLAIVGIILFASSLLIAGVTTAYFRKDFRLYGLAAWPYVMLIGTPVIGLIFLISAPLPEGISLIISDSASVGMFGILFFTAARHLWKGRGLE